MIGTIVHYFPGIHDISWHYHDNKKHASCIAAIISREPHISSTGETELLSDLVIFDNGVKSLTVPHHPDFKTHEYHDYDKGSWHTIEECESKQLKGAK